MSRVLRGSRTVVTLLTGVLTTLLLTSGTALAAPPYDPVIGRIPYQPGPMLVDPGASAATANPYGFNLAPVGGVANPAYYELRDSYTVKLYFNYRNSTDSATKAKEQRWLEGLDDIMSTMVLETNKWVGGRLRYESYDGDAWADGHPDNTIAIVYADISSTAVATPSTAVDQRGVVYNGGLVRLNTSDVWTGLLDDATHGDTDARHSVGLVVMHELAHNLGLAHYNTPFHGDNTLMSSIRTYDQVDSWNDIYTPGDKAGLMNMAGWRNRAISCSATRDCDRIWEKGAGIAWPPQPVDHTYDRVPH